MHTTVGCVIMASGLGKRFGSQKLLVEFNGKKIIEYAADKLCLFDEYAVITRNAEIAAMFKNSILHNKPQRSDAVKIGTSALSDCDGICFMAADQPLLTSESVLSLINKFRENSTKIYRLGFGKEGGNPVIFPKKFYSELLQLSGKNGGSAVIAAHPGECVIVQMKNKCEMLDIDKKEDLDKIVLNCC